MLTLVIIVVDAPLRVIEQSVGIIHESFGRRELNLGPEGSRVVCGLGSGRQEK